MERERVFYKTRGLPNPKDQTGAEDEANGGAEEAVKGQDYHRLDEQVSNRRTLIMTGLYSCK